MPAVAWPQSKDACLEAHGKGQDLREAGKVSEAREQFLKCAQSACPSMVQSDCARFSEELQRIVPTVTFVARDGRGNDLPDVSVFVDDVAVASKLTGKSYELDPGSRTVRFVYGDKTIEQKVVVSQGEKGRTVAATFEDPSPAAAAPASSAAAPAAMASADDAEQPSRSVVPLVIAGAGLVTAAVGAVIIGVGLGDVPDNCSYSDKECVAAPEDPVFDDAKSAAGTVNLGIGLAAAGAGVAGLGLVWYLVQDPGAPAAATTGKRDAPAGRKVTPWFSRNGGGLNFRTAF
ncbi:MAG: hypothetical protein WKG00_28285 [Polyangiaceae bacterium]